MAGSAREKQRRRPSRPARGSVPSTERLPISSGVRPAIPIWPPWPHPRDCYRQRRVHGEYQTCGGSRDGPNEGSHLRPPSVRRCPAPPRRPFGAAPAGGRVGAHGSTGQLDCAQPRCANSEEGDRKPIDRTVGRASAVMPPDRDRPRPLTGHPRSRRSSHRADREPWQEPRGIEPR